MTTPQEAIEAATQVLGTRRAIMSTWNEPCVRDNEEGAHDFEPVVTDRRVFINNETVIAICRKCGVHR